MRMLVTGGSGFLGGRLAQMLSAQGHEVVVLARHSSDLRHLSAYQLQIAYGDIRDKDSLRRALHGCQVVYHCAGLSTDWATLAQFAETNINGVQNILDCAVELPALERFVHISTTDVYGYPLVACDETHPLVDVGLPYNRSKLRGEQLVGDAARRHRLPITIFRPACIYGPRGTEFVGRMGDQLRSGFLPLLDGGRTHAGLIYVDNAVNALIACLEHPASIGEAYNLRDDFAVSWREYIAAFAAHLGKKAPTLSLPSAWALRAARLLEGTFHTLHLSAHPVVTRHAILVLCRDQGYAIDKARHDLGFTTTIGLEEGLERSIAWYRNRSS